MYPVCAAGAQRSVPSRFAVFAFLHPDASGSLSASPYSAAAELERAASNLRGRDLIARLVNACAERCVLRFQEYTTWAWSRESALINAGLTKTRGRILFSRPAGTSVTSFFSRTNE